ncbi:nitroreductase family protein [Bacteroidota bacterium]
MASKEAQTDFPIHPLLVKRWSPRAFQDKTIEKEKLQNIFEAARWSPSGSNQQPWRFIIGFKGDDTYERIFKILVEFNQIWTKTVPVLILSCGRKVMNENEAINPSYSYDVGQSVAYMTIQAMQEGLYVHQMGGFNKKQAVRLFKIPANYKPMSVIAIGYINKHTILPVRMQKSELAVRSRMKAETWVYSGVFGERSDLF